MVKLRLLKQMEVGQLGVVFTAEMRGKRRKRERRKLKISICISKGLSLRMGRTYKLCSRILFYFFYIKDFIQLKYFLESQKIMANFFFFCVCFFNYYVDLDLQ